MYLSSSLEQSCGTLTLKRRHLVAFWDLVSIHLLHLPLLLLQDNHFRVTPAALAHKVNHSKNPTSCYWSLARTHL